jgi:hypothetical protein
MDIHKEEDRILDEYEKCYHVPEEGRKKVDFDYNLIKGRIAESLVEQLFSSLNFSVFRYGMENTVPGIMKFLKNDNTPAAKNIKRMPDFIVQDNFSRRVFFIEVKFRKDGKFNKLDDDFKKHGESFEEYPYKDCFFVIVSKNHIKCISYNDLREKRIEKNDDKYLFNIKDFDFKKEDREIIIRFCEYATKFFHDV